ncbi:hypothetical protein Slin14017_G057070 [Septoria linicola]|nr:hypothetical protein Slin14017_G057070 [Septoria linicola]
MLALPATLLSLLLVTASATPVALLAERQSQQINMQFSIPEAQFRTFEDANTLRSYLQSRGYNYNLNYAQLSQGVASVDQYFARKAAQTTSSSDNNGFPTSGETVQTNTRSTTLRGGPSYTNNSMSATANLVQVISFSDGNAATAGGAIQRAKTSSSTSTSGASNSTATVTGSPALIDVTSTVTGATDRRVVNGSPQDALTAGDCAAGATGASAQSSITTTLTIPVNVTSPAQSVANIASSFCEAGVSARRAGTPFGSGTSVGSTQAALTNGGVAAVVSCNGRQVRGTPNTVFDVTIQGSYSASAGFRGTFVGRRTASVSVNCS